MKTLLTLLEESGTTLSEGEVAESIINAINGYSDSEEQRLIDLNQVELILRMFKQEIVLDFLDLGIDIRNEIEDCNWSYILTIIEGLPAWSRYAVAFRNNPETVEDYIEIYKKNNIGIPEEGTLEEEINRERLTRHPFYQAGIHAGNVINNLFKGKPLPAPTDLIDYKIREIQSSVSKIDVMNFLMFGQTDNENLVFIDEVE